MATTTIPKQHLLGIDARTKGSRRLWARLRRLKSTVSIATPDPYREDPSYCQIRINTTKTADELDHWLWSVKHGVEYVGVFSREPSKG